MNKFKSMLQDYKMGFVTSYEFLNQMTDRIESVGFGFVDIKVVDEIHRLEDAADIVRKVYGDDVAWDVIDAMFRPIALTVYDMVEELTK